KGKIGLIVDIGGGTSDFSVFRSAGAQPDILANHGIRLGGTDFDQAVSMAYAMPLLGLGGQLRRQMGAGLLPVPRAPYVDLATWAKIPFLYTGETRRMVAEMARLAVDHRQMARFVTVLEMELGHELAFAVERGKIAANTGEGAGGIDMGFIERGLSQPVTREGMDAVLADNRALLRKAAIETLDMAGVERDQIGRVILVGGSSLMRFVSDEVTALCPNAEILYSDAFTAVVDGLALATHR
ncbi:MAG: putative chaperone protein, partial [Paracoccaceae bacterium]